MIAEFRKKDVASAMPGGGMESRGITGVASAVPSPPQPSSRAKLRARAKSCWRSRLKTPLPDQQIALEAATAMEGCNDCQAMPAQCA